MASSEIMFYPELGIDIVGPIMAVPNINKIITLGPVPEGMFEKSKVERTMDYISKLVEYGDTRHIGKKGEDIVEFFPDIGERLKSYNFKTTKMWLSQYRIHNGNTVTLNYYYDARQPQLPFKERVDYIYHNNFHFTDSLKAQLNSIVKPTTQLIARDTILLDYWKVPESVVDELQCIDTYNVYTDEDEDLYKIPFKDLTL